MLKYKKEKGKEKYEKPASKVLDIFGKAGPKVFVSLSAAPKQIARKKLEKQFYF